MEVKGENAQPLFKYLTENTEFKGFGKGVKRKALELMLKQKYGKGFSDSSVKWNFTKFLIDRQGNITGRFEPTATPESMTGAIEECL